MEGEGETSGIFKVWTECLREKSATALSKNIKGSFVKHILHRGEGSL